MAANDCGTSEVNQLVFVVQKLILENYIGYFIVTLNSLMHDQLLSFINHRVTLRTISTTMLYTLGGAVSMM